MSYSCYYYVYKGTTHFYASYIPDDHEDQQEYSNSGESEYWANQPICASIGNRKGVKFLLEDSDKKHNTSVAAFLESLSKTGRVDDQMRKIYNKIWCTIDKDDTPNAKVILLPIVEFNTDDLGLEPGDFTKMKSLLSSINYALWIYVNLHSCNQFHHSTEDTRYAQELLREILKDVNSYDLPLDIITIETRLREALFLTDEKTLKRTCFNTPLAYTRY